MGKNTKLCKRLASFGLCATMFASALAYLPGDVFNTPIASADSVVSWMPPEWTASTADFFKEAVEGYESISESNDLTWRLDGTITLENNIDLGDYTIHVAERGNLVINLNGYTLSSTQQMFSVEGTLKVSGGTLSATTITNITDLMWIYNGATATVTDTHLSSAGSGTMFYIAEGGSLTFAGDTQITGHKCQSGAKYFYGSVYNMGTFTMTGGSLNNITNTVSSSKDLPLLTNTSTGVFNANGGTIGGSSGERVVNEGKILCTTTTPTTIAAAVTNTGTISAGNFTGQVSNSTSGVISGGTFSFTTGAYTVTFNTNGGSTAPASQIRCNAPISVPSNPSREGYAFTGWYSNGTLWDNAANVTSNLNLIAGWKDTQAPTISGITNGGKYCIAKTFTVSDNVGVTSVTSNGTSLAATNGAYSLPTSNSEQTIAVKDAAGNTTTYSVYVYPSHAYDSNGECTVCGESDSTPPVIAGIENNGQYCEAVEFTVTDESVLTSVTANGGPLTANNGAYALTAGENEDITIVATDVKGNSTTYTIKLYATHTYENGACKVCKLQDTEAPKIAGIENNGVYCVSADFTVSDNAGIDSVMINGEPATAVNGKYTINPASAKQVIAVTDVSNNTTVYYVTVHDSHTKGDNGKCTACGGFIDGITAHPAGYTLSLSGSIGVNFYMELDADVIADTGAYMQFALPNGTTLKVYVKDVETDTTTTAGTTYYIFSCEVAAKEMYADIQAQIMLSDGSSSDVYTFKVEDYANYILDDDNGYDEKTQDLVTAMLNYGSFAKAYFNEETLSATTEMESIAAATLSGYAFTATGTLPEGITYYGSTLILESETAIRHYFKVAEGTDISAYNMTAKDGFYYVQVSDIAADDLGVAQTTTIGEYSISYSAMSYAYAVLNGGSSDQNLINLVKALYLYDQAAVAYNTVAIDLPNLDIIEGAGIVYW